MDQQDLGLNAHQVIEGVFEELCKRGRCFAFNCAAVRREMYDEGHRHKYGYWRYDANEPREDWRSEKGAPAPGPRPFAVLQVDGVRLGFALARIYGDYVVDNLRYQLDVFRFETIADIAKVKHGDWPSYCSMIRTSDDARFQMVEGEVRARFNELVPDDNFLKSFIFKWGIARSDVRHFSGVPVMAIPNTFKTGLVPALTEKLLESVKAIHWY